MSLATFVGRVHELDELRLLSQKATASLAVVFGRRWVGKSRLLDYFGEHIEHNYYRFSGLVPTKQTTAQAQRDEFSIQLSEKLKLLSVTGGTCCVCG